LQQAPPDKQDDAEAVAQSAEALIKTATAGKPNKTMLRVNSDGLKQTAQTLADEMPQVLSIATQMVATLTKLTT
jgi:hypothetical protein